MPRFYPKLSYLQHVEHTQKNVINVKCNTVILLRWIHENMYILNSDSHCLPSSNTPLGPKQSYAKRGQKGVKLGYVIILFVKMFLV